MDPTLKPVKPKRRSTHTDYGSCLICQKGSDNDILHQLTDVGYPAFLYAVTNREDDVSFRLRNDIVKQSDCNSDTIKHHFLEHFIGLRSKDVCFYYIDALFNLLVCNYYYERKCCTCKATLSPPVRNHLYLNVIYNQY